MDLITAFSIACGVIQLVDFSTKVVFKCREVYKSGSTSEHAELRNMAEHLTSLQSNCLSIAQSTPGGQSSFSANDQELVELAQRCSTVATTLVDELKSLEATASQSYRSAVKLSIKGIGKKNKIDRLQKQLDQYRQAMDTKVLKDLRERAIHNSVQQAENFGRLHENIRALISGLTQGQTTLNELKQVLNQRDEATKQHISHEFRQLQLSSSEKEYRKKYLESLWFPEINAREEGIKDAHKNTYK